MHDRRTFRWVRPLTHPVVGVVIAAGFVVAQLYIQPAVGWFGGEPVVIAGYSVLVALLLPSLLHAGPLHWALSRRPMTIFGERSYAVYLVQGLGGLVVVGTLNTRPGAAQVALTALVSLIFADVLHRWVERPMIDLGRRLSRPRRAAVPSVPTPPVPAVPQRSAARQAHARAVAHSRAAAPADREHTVRAAPVRADPVRVESVRVESVRVESVRVESAAPAFRLDSAAPAFRLGPAAPASRADAAAASRADAAAGGRHRRAAGPVQDRLVLNDRRRTPYR
jgi:hypothetical protein